ncbi:uncharacterized protein LOC133176472 [Saccostrea echinata]|uniref:uncharacterized protein LOC133176472 n=1 Tax=Saccostrea echinata TaxID=191078 RepID=UPI002A830010|nr:uncharacterized protein LOC133176472 [Saccostrea echinata]
MVAVFSLFQSELDAASVHCGYHGHYYTSMYSSSNGCTTRWYKLYKGYCTSSGTYLYEVRITALGMQLYYKRISCKRRSLAGINKDTGESIEKKDAKEYEYDSIQNAFSRGTN